MTRSIRCTYRETLAKVVEVMRNSLGEWQNLELQNLGGSFERDVEKVTEALLKSDRDSNNLLHDCGEEEERRPNKPKAPSSGCCDMVQHAYMLNVDVCALEEHERDVCQDEKVSGIDVCQSEEMPDIKCEGGVEPVFAPRARRGPRDWNEELRPLYWGRPTVKKYFPPPVTQPKVEVKKFMQFLSVRKLRDGRSLAELVDEPENRGD